MGSDGASVVSQPIAIVLIVLILGASIFLWTRGQLRSRAAMLTVAGIIAVLVYFAFWAAPTVA
jgi:hypothetical protein